MTTALASPRTAAYGTALLRISLGVLFLVHGLTKLLVFTPAGAVAYFHSLGLPAALAYISMTLELGLGVSLLLGIHARWVALLGVPLLLGTIVSVHGANGFGFSNPGGGWEYPALWTVLLIVQALLGDGAFALKPPR
ncbi:DoxX family protein [Xanthomonas vasicola]|uniref:DoxX family protein n=1 Tax=Xanthomonas vasicola TaxID=56459 RepID=UPI0001CC0CF1|nr:DoxX family protein [Xanthomonas vasicola]KFA15922.1 LysR family transcriptional regulator [Xanthomonas vasicola pv. musacearum NCPPB 4384]AZR32536.1 DoxX family protein [Xanthomonas vasicola pv. musacearum NCPPB 4379]KFA11234.1 LysR family transcriptional regulator [Xanthomonas vasicola pv. musacearum NCPPB 2005]KFA12360.1 LysR family transcriptional regulator [Xanthomonas vasicola pv. musacearum NCPPB 4380]KFA20728.1 LysR family transcriptional regulator [Xanthomonas vasicola pv. musacear